MNTAEKNKTILDFIKENKLGVISTISINNKPESAVMVISEKENLHLIFQTPNDSRKYKNLEVNNNVSVVFGFNLNEFITIQYEGIAQEISEKEIDFYRKIHVAKNPKSAEYAYLEENKYFVITPKWIRYSNLSINQKFELTF